MESRNPKGNPASLEAARKAGQGSHYGRKGLPVDWDAIKTLWCAGRMTSKEIAAMFPPAKSNSIETRASREGWRELRDQARAYMKAAKAGLRQMRLLVNKLPLSCLFPSPKNCTATQENIRAAPCPIPIPKNDCLRPSRINMAGTTFQEAP
jgi:hypothetical protein